MIRTDSSIWLSDDSSSAVIRLAAENISRNNQIDESVVAPRTERVQPDSMLLHGQATILQVSCCLIALAMPGEATINVLVDSI